MSDEVRGSNLVLRRPTAADHRRVVGVVDEWWGGRKVRAILPRLWFEHFNGSSWIAETDDGRLGGFLVGFRSPDQPTEAYIHMVGTDPNWRRQGIGRTLYQAFFDDMAAAGVQQVHAITWPGNRGSVAFHRALGFEPDAGPGTQRLYGTPAYPDHDGEGEDRVVFSRRLGASPG